MRGFDSRLRLMEYYNYNENGASPLTIIVIASVFMVIGFVVLVQTITSWDAFVPGTGVVTDISIDPNCTDTYESGTDCTVVIVGYSVGSVSYESPFGTWIGASVGDPVSFVYDTRNPQVIEPKNSLLRLTFGPVLMLLSGAFLWIGFRLRRQRL